MLHISPRIPNQPFADLPTEEEIVYFLRFLGHSHDIRYLTDVNVVSRHQTTQQYGAILPIELTTTEIRNSKAYKEYHACAMGEEAPKPKASARKKKDVGSYEEGKKSYESDDDHDEGSDDDSEETVKAGAGKDDDDDADVDDDDNDEEKELAKSDEEDKETRKGGDEVRESEGES
nr:hypothetical protein [Tanacetum cinerariifolium]